MALRILFGLTGLALLIAGIAMLIPAAQTGYELLSAQSAGAVVTIDVVGGPPMSPEMMVALSLGWPALFIGLGFWLGRWTLRSTGEEKREE